MGKAVVLDASAVVEALLGTAVGVQVRSRMIGHALYAPAHLDAEVLSALGRLCRAGSLSEQVVSRCLSDFASAPVLRRPVLDLIEGAWTARDRFRLVDGLYVELARLLGVALITTDGRLARVCGIAELVSV